MSRKRGRQTKSDTSSHAPFITCSNRKVIYNDQKEATTWSNKMTHENESSAIQMQKWRQIFSLKVKTNAEQNLKWIIRGDWNASGASGQWPKRNEYLLSLFYLLAISSASPFATSSLSLDRICCSFSPFVSLVWPVGRWKKTICGTWATECSQVKLRKACVLCDRARTSVWPAPLWMRLS
jgi:hypothetical protein